MNNIEFSTMGIGKLIAVGRLQVPIHQREYSWEEGHVLDLFNDFNEAIRTGKPSYFLGTIVLTKPTPDGFQVVDGQQRLATTTIMLATIRDIFYSRQETKMVQHIESEFLFRIDPATEEESCKLKLNLKDHEFFLNSILLGPDNPKRHESREAAKKSLVQSNARLIGASRSIRTNFENLMKSTPEPSKKDALKSWLGFIHDNAQLIVLTVAGDANAFTMFETLNDRGLKVSEADLVKNYIFGVSGSRLPEVQARWASMVTMLESLGLDESAIDYLRILCTVLFGLTREREVHDKIKGSVNSQAGAIQFVHQLEEFAHDYVAVLNPNHSKWNEYPPLVPRSLRTLDLFGVEQIRYLMLAVAHHFSPKEAAKSFNLFVNWIVRFFVVGDWKLGRIDQVYARLAHTIHTTNEIKTAQDLANRMQPFLADDDQFKVAFSIFRVSQSKLARYYLDALERKSYGDDSPELVPNDDTTQVNLEHVIPLNPQTHWAHLDPEQATALYNRLGNMALLSAKTNSKIGDQGFSEKKKVFAKSSFALTKSIAKNSSWGAKEIEHRQAQLAEIAVKTWPLKIK